MNDEEDKIIPTVEEVDQRIEHRAKDGVETLKKIGAWLRETAAFSDRGIADYDEWPEAFGADHACTSYIIAQLGKKKWRARLYYGHGRKLKHPVLRIKKP